MIDHEAHSSDEELHRLYSITDSALSRLDTDALYLELLERVRSLLAADVAAIMLLDPDAQQLVAAAAIGLEAEVDQGLRISLGSGFAGRVAAERAPIVMDPVEPESLGSQVLRDAGIASLVGVPMLSDGDLVGVLDVGTYQPRAFSASEVSLLQAVADRAALATRAAEVQTDRVTTLALQRSLLPSRLPPVPGLELAARYLPGHHVGVGGDWYDVFPLPSGELGVVVGDVTGHGLRAAVVMGRLRSALRAYALIEDDPATVLSFLDRKITHFEAGNLATILYAKVSPDRTGLRASSAGHLPPVVAQPDGTVARVTVPVDIPVGVGDQRPRHSSHIDLCPGSTVVFYTDGLVERRDKVIDEGLDRLSTLVRPDHPEAVCAAVMAGMDVAAADDDIAVLALRVNAQR